MLPKPRFAAQKKAEIEAVTHILTNAKTLQVPHTTTHKIRDIPAYGQRNGFFPKSTDDYADGGAFPEIHQPQYPLNMGKPNSSDSNTQLALAVDGDGRVQYDQIIRQGLGADRIVHTKFTDLVERAVDEDALQKPTEEDEQSITERTRAALEKIVQAKISVAHTSNAQSAFNQNKDENIDTQQATFYRYTPAKGSSLTAPESRIIQIVEAPVDPMQPAKFRHKKLPKAGGSPPVPVMHSPPKKLSKEDYDNWKLPPAISNYKNPKGFTIPLHMRLAADGRGLQQIQISEKFAKLSESMYVAEMNAKEEIEKRHQYEKYKVIKDNEAKEEMLRRLAQQAREQRTMTDSYGKKRRSDDERSSSSEDESDKDDEQERISLRKKLREEAEEEYKNRHKKKKNAFADRDVTEKVALGQAPKPSTFEADVDTRLLNYSATGMDSGFGDDDSYNVFDKPLLKGSSANQIYQPRKANIQQFNPEMEDDHFVSEKEANSSKKKTTSERPSGPVQFERAQPAEEKQQQEAAKPSSSKPVEADPFGLGKFITETKQAGKSLDNIGRKGMMNVAAGSGYQRDSDSFSKRSRVEFESSNNNNKDERSSKRQRRE